MPTTAAFCSTGCIPFRSDNVLFSTVDADAVAPSEQDLKELKSALVFVCKKQPKASIQEVKDAIQEVEAVGEQVSV